MKYLGIDGGGTKTTFLLIGANDQVLCRCQSGPSNWLSIGQEAAAAALQEGLASLPSKPEVVCGGFAGAGRPEAQAFYRNTLTSLLPDARVLVESDAFISYIGAIGFQPGVLLIAGTGSIAIGRRENGSMIRVGGWGPHFGDEGSGFWIGREAIRTALRAVDSAQDSEFADRITRALGYGHMGEVVPEWATGKIGVPQIAELFREVTQIHPAEPASRILKQAAAHLKAMAEIAVERVGHPASRQAVSGSVALHPTMRMLIGPSFVEPQHPPEMGAVMWAKRTFA